MAAHFRRRRDAVEEAFCGGDGGIKYLLLPSSTMKRSKGSTKQEFSLLLYKSCTHSSRSCSLFSFDFLSSLSSLIVSPAHSFCFLVCEFGFIF